MLPIVAGLLLSLTDFDIYALADLRNLRWRPGQLPARVEMPLFWTSLANTAYFVGLGVPLSLGLSLAQLCQAVSRWRASSPLFRTGALCARGHHLVAVAVIWRYLFHVKYGWIQPRPASAGAGPHRTGWATRTGPCRPSSLAAWKNFGGNMPIIFIAALQAVPQDLYDAARPDGVPRLGRSSGTSPCPSLAPTVLMVKHPHHGWLLPSSFAEPL